MKIVYFSVTSNEIPNLSEAYRLFMEEHPGMAMDLYARTRTQLADNKARQEAFVKKALEADVVIITLMAGHQSCPAWDALIHAVSAEKKGGKSTPWFHVQPTGSNPDSLEMVKDFSDGTDDDTWTTISRYYRYGGVDNLLNLLRFLYHDHHHRMPGDESPSEGGGSESKDKGG